MLWFPGQLYLVNKNRLYKGCFTLGVISDTMNSLKIKGLVRSYLISPPIVHWLVKIKK